MLKAIDGYDERSQTCILLTPGKPVVKVHSTLPRQHPKFVSSHILNRYPINKHGIMNPRPIPFWECILSHFLFPFRVFMASHIFN